MEWRTYQELIKKNLVVVMCVGAWQWLGPGLGARGDDKSDAVVRDVCVRFSIGR